MPTTFPVLLANGFIELGALAVDGTLNAVTVSWAMMIDWLRTGVQGDDVTHAAEDLESARRLSQEEVRHRAVAALCSDAARCCCCCRSWTALRAAARRAVACRFSGRHAVAVRRRRAVAAAARAGRERPARLIGLDLACALLAFSRLRAGGGSI